MDLEFFVLGDDGAESWWEFYRAVPNAGDTVYRGDDSYKVSHRTFNNGAVGIVLVKINYDVEEIPY